MIRIREIVDPDLRQRIRAALADRRGLAAAAIPDWYELDDLDFVDLLNDLQDASTARGVDPEVSPEDSRM